MPSIEQEEPDVQAFAKSHPSSRVLLKTFSFSIYVTTAIIVSFFPLYYDYLGFSKRQIGALYSIGPAVGICSHLLWGILSDKFQTLKKTILAVLFGQLAMIVLLFQFQSYSAIFMIMIVFSFFQTPLVGLNDSQILLIASQSKKSYASFRVWGSIGFAVAALGFGLLLKHQGMQTIAILSVTTISISFLLSMLLKESRGSYKKMDFSGIYKIILSKRFLWFLVLIFIISVAHRTNDGFLALYLHQLGASQDLIGYSWMMAAVSEIPIFFLLSRYGNRYKELPLLACACFAYVIRFYLMSITKDPHFVIAIQIIHSVSFGIFLFTALRYIQQIVPDEYRATGQAMFNLTWGGFAGLASGLIGGNVFQQWGGQTMYRFAAWMAFIAMIGFLATHWFTKDDL